MYLEHFDSEGQPCKCKTFLSFMPLFHHVSLSWRICLAINTLLVVPTLLIYIWMLYRFFAHAKRHQLAQLTKATSFISLTLSTFSSLCFYATFPGCKPKDSCGENFLGDFFMLSTADTYVLSKISLYIVFVSRLRLFHGSAYHYRKGIISILVALIIIIFIGMAVFNYLAICTEYDTSWVPVSLFIGYASCDIILSSITLILFIRPLRHLIISRLDTIHVETVDIHLDTESEMSQMTHVVTRYTTCAVVAMMSSMICSGFIILRVTIGAYHAFNLLDQTLLDIKSVVHIADNLISMSCIMLKFKFSEKYYSVICSPCNAVAVQYHMRRLKRSFERRMTAKSKAIQSKSVSQIVSKSKSLLRNSLSADGSLVLESDGVQVQ